jgi:hypothetical protein
MSGSHDQVFNVEEKWHVAFVEIEVASRQVFAEGFNRES